ncbi:MAG: Asp-tRNA(Asn)/Glu-tRNA(Gln) amidotransferase subunit GatC [Ostreibacterium sp.]
MKINNSTLAQIEKLAKLQISEEDRTLTLNKITNILDKLDNLNLDDITDLAPLYHPLEITQPMREDIANPTIIRDEIQAHSPQTQQGLFLVPNVIE